MSTANTGEGQTEVNSPGISLEVDASDGAQSGVVEISEAEAREFGIDLGTDPAADATAEPASASAPAPELAPAAASGEAPDPRLQVLEETVKTLEGKAKESEELQKKLEEKRKQLEEQAARLEEKNKQAEDKHKQAYERLLRATADLDNLRKRTKREIDDAKTDAKGKVIKEILPVLDNLERAMVHADQSADKDNKGIRAGVELVQRQFLQALERCGVKPVEVLHTMFDPNMHEAVGQKESADHPAGTVVEVFQRGYMVGERLLRPALVVVSRVPALAPPAASGEASAPEPAVDPAVEVASEPTADAAAANALAAATEAVPEPVVETENLSSPTMVDDPPPVDVIEPSAVAAKADAMNTQPNERPRSTTIPYSGVPAEDSSKPDGSGGEG